MPATRPVLKKKRADGRQMVAIEYRHRATRTQISTGILIRPDCLDKDKSKVLARPSGSRGVAPDPHAGKSTTRLREYQNAIDRAVERLKLDGIEPTARRVKEMALADIKGEESSGYGPIAADYLREMVHRRRNDITDSTQKTYLVTANRLDRFTPKVCIGQMDRNWLDGYIRQLREAGLAAGTIWAEAKQLRTLLNDAQAHGHTTMGQHRTRGWMPKIPKTETYSLTADELDQLRNAILNDRLDAVRDLFLFASATGMRYSELAALNESAVWNLAYDKAEVRFYATKTDSWKVVPLNSEARRILDKRDGVLPRVMTNQKANDYLKEVGAKTELNRIVPRTKTGELVPLSESLSMHDARRTFATLAWRDGVPPAVIMGLTGHTSEKQLRTYINVTDTEAAEDARRHSFSHERASTLPSIRSPYKGRTRRYAAVRLLVNR